MGLIRYSCVRIYLGPPWTNSCQIWCVRIFHHVLLKYCHENAEMLKKKIWWRHTSVLYCLRNSKWQFSRPGTDSRVIYQTIQNIVFINNSGTTWPIEILMPIFKLLRQLALGCLYCLKKKLWSFWDGAQNILNSGLRCSSSCRSKINFKDTVN